MIEGLVFGWRTAVLTVAAAVILPIVVGLDEEPWVSCNEPSVLGAGNVFQMRSGRMGCRRPAGAVAPTPEHG